jgi:hypothetical protein
MIKNIALILVAAIAGLLVYASTKPDVFQVRRSTHIKATPDKIQPLIADLHQFNTWNPYNKKDPAMQSSYEGPASGTGSTYRFKGNKDVGSGSVSVTAVQPGKVEMALDMTEPFACHNIIAFTLQPQGDGTEVTWAMHGPSHLVSKVMGVIFDMDKMVGRDFEAGLRDLKASAEAH